MDEALRERLLGPWGRGLQPDQLSDALATAGLVEAKLAERRHFDLGQLGLAELLNELRIDAVRSIDERVPQRWFAPNQETLAALPAEDAHAALTGLPLRIAVVLSDEMAELADALVRGLPGLASGGSAFVVMDEPDFWGYGLVAWPLRVGFAADVASRGLRPEADWLWHPKLVELVDEGPFDVLLTAAPGAEPNERVVELPGEPDPDRPPALIVAVAGPGTALADPYQLAASIASETGASGVQVATNVADVAYWFNCFVDNLSHDEPIDRALALADEAHDAHGLAVLSPQTLTTFRLSFIVDQITQWFWAQHDRRIEIPPSTSDRFPNFPTGPDVPLGDVADYLSQHADRFEYEHESDESESVADLVQAAGGFPTEVIWGAGPPPETDEASMVSTEPDDVDEAVSQPDDVDEAISEPDDVETLPIPRQLGADVLVDHRSLRHAFVAGIPAKVRVSIGRSAAHLTGVPIDPDLDVDDEEQDEVELPVWARFEQELHEGTITVPLDPARDSTENFEFTVTPIDVDRVEIEIVVYQPGGTEVLQAALLSGDIVDTLADEEVAPPSISTCVVSVQDLLAGPERIPSESLIHSGSGGLVNVGGKPIPIAVDATTSRQWMTATVTAIQQGAAGEELFDTPIDELLVNLAGRGAVRLAQLPELQALRACPRVQVISLVKHDVFPVDLFYSGPKPDPEAHLCADWRTSLKENDFCPTCGADGPSDGSTVCPFQFWSMSKIIEHHGPVDGPSTTFSATGFRTLRDREIGPLAPIVVGVSEKVLEVDPKALTDLAAEFDEAEEAKNWSEWTELVSRRGPGLLVAMPHQEVTMEYGAETAALELGGQMETTFGAAHVTRRTAPPGPLVLLLGCETAAGGAHALASFASVFRGYGASLVVSSLGDVIAKQAPVAATAFLRSLDGVLDGQTRSLGDALLKTRRVLLADGKLLPLMLVTHGDPEWKVE